MMNWLFKNLFILLMMKINQNKIILKKNQKNKKIKNLIQNNQNHILIIEIILIIKNLININKNFIIILIKIAIFTIISKEIIIHKKEIEKAEVEIEVDIIVSILNDLKFLLNLLDFLKNDFYWEYDFD